MSVVFRLRNGSIKLIRVFTKKYIVGAYENKAVWGSRIKETTVYIHLFETFFFSLCKSGRFSKLTHEIKLDIN